MASGLGGGATDRRDGALLVVGNALPVVAVATGWLSIGEAFLAYLLEVPIAGLALGIALLVGTPSSSRQPSAAVDDDWAARLLDVRRWNVLAAVSALAGFGVTMLVLVGSAIVFVTLVHNESGAAPFSATVSGLTVGTAACGLLVVHLRDLASFLVDPPRGVTDGELRARFDVLAWRVSLIVFAFLLAAALTNVFVLAVPTVLLVLFAVIKTVVDLLFEYLLSEPDGIVAPPGTDDTGEPPGH